MFKIQAILMVTILCLSSSSVCDSPPSDNCRVISSKYFPWLAEDGSLAKNVYLDIDQNEPPSNCFGSWQPLRESPSCRFCRGSSSLICEGSDVYSIPPASSLPTTNFSLFKMAGVGLIALPPESFAGLTIKHLVIEYSNLSYLAANTFTGVKSIKYLHVMYNTLDYISDVDHLFEGINDLSFVELTGNGLRVLSSMRSANLKNLRTFSLADNPIHSLSVEFLQNSDLRLLDLQHVSFELNSKDIKSFSSLPHSLTAVDLNGANMSSNIFGKIMETLSTKNITTLNLGNLKSKIDGLFAALWHVKTSLKHLSLQSTPLENNLSIIDEETLQAPIKFDSLAELNMKNCGIQKLGRVMTLFPNLTVLSLSDNPLLVLDLNIFLELPTLNYLDFSKNKMLSIFNGSDYVAEYLKEIDLSYTEINLRPADLNKVLSTMQNLQSLSLCDATITNENVNSLFYFRNLKLLDLSGVVQINEDILPSLSNLFASSNTNLTELHFSRNNLDFFTLGDPTIFSHLESLKMINLSDNFIRGLSSEFVLGPWVESVVLSKNLVTTWYISFFGPKLKNLDLEENQLTYISDAMYSDFDQTNYLNLNNNPLTCDDRVIKTVCNTITNQSVITNWLQNRCYDPVSGFFRHFQTSTDCLQYFSAVSAPTHTWSTTMSPSPQKNTFTTNFTWLYILTGVVVVTVPLGLLIYWKWWTIRCYFHRYLSLRRARILRKSDEALTKSEVQYDVFISYSDNDRSWVLDYLVPNLESDGDIRLCFHERDFQVGLSILENIIECMDRSNCLMLIVSSAFVRSKWCQFEMHLAQYRLIETFRDQIVLVLLEDIPRKSRPQTLHHMMMTKTYLMWPIKEDARELFWKRLKRAIQTNHGYIFDI